MIKGKAEIERAVEILRQGGLVAFPTDTVFGLAGDAGNDQAVARIFAAKARPTDSPLPVMVAEVAAAQKIAEFGVAARLLAEAFWPGPLTLVLPLMPDCGLAKGVSAGKDTVAIRIPAHPLALSLLQAFGGPLAVTSANPSGAPSPVMAEEVASGLGSAVGMILDGTPSPTGTDSTIVTVETLETMEKDSLLLLRKGDIAADALARVAGLPVGEIGE